MASIGNKVQITLIDDGSQLHATLLSTKGLNQGWMDGTGGAPGAVDPNWDMEHVADQPTIYLDIANGTTPVSVTEIKWLYNGDEISFETSQSTITWTVGGTTYTINGYYSTDSKFFRYKYIKPSGQETTEYEALRIVNNLAASNNVDEDTITIDGKAVVNTAQIPFRSNILITITSLSANGGYNPIISSSVSTISNFQVPDGGFVFTGYPSTEQPRLILYMRLTKADASSFAPITYNEFQARWYVNGTRVTETYQNGDTGNPAKIGAVWVNNSNGNIVGVVGVGSTPSDCTAYNALFLHKDYITDYAIIRCDCYTNTSSEADAVKLCSDDEMVDDKTDPEMMYVASMVSQVGGYQDPTTNESSSQSESGEGCSNTLKTGQQVNYAAWVGRNNNSTYKDTRFKYFYIECVKSNQHVYGELTEEQERGLSDTSLIRQGSTVASDYSNWFLMNYQNLAGVSEIGRWFLTANDLISMGRNMTGYIFAWSAPVPSNT